MYVFQFMDATWRIAHLTNSKEPMPRWGTEALRLYDHPYETRTEAEAGLRRIREMEQPS